MSIGLAATDGAMEIHSPGRRGTRPEKVGEQSGTLRPIARKFGREPVEPPRCLSLCVVRVELGEGKPALILLEDLPCHSRSGAAMRPARPCQNRPAHATAQTRAPLALRQWVALSAILPPDFRSVSSAICQEPQRLFTMPSWIVTVDFDCALHNPAPPIMAPTSRHLEWCHEFKAFAQ